MRLEQKMKILLEDIEKQKKKVEDDIREYASLLSQEEEHENKIEELERKENVFEKFLSDIIGKSHLETASVKSIHCKEIKEELFQEKSVLKEVKESIQKHQPYYTLLRNEDYMELWKLGEEDSQRAAIYFAYSKKYSIDATKKFIESKRNCSKSNLFYLLERALLEGETNRLSDEKKRELDFMLLEFAKNMKCNLDTAIGAAIKDSVNIRETNRCLVECENLIEEYSKDIQDVEDYKKSWNTSCQNIQTQVNNLKADKLGKEVEKKIQEIKNWFSEYSSDKATFIKEKEKRVPQHRENIEALESIKNNLEAAKDWGMELDALDRIHTSLLEFHSKRTSILSEKELEEGHLDGLDELKYRLRDLNAMKKDIVAEHEKKLEEKVKAKSAFRKKTKACFLVIGMIVIYLFMGVGFGTSYTMMLSTYLPAPMTAKRIDIDDSLEVPYVLSLGMVDALVLDNSTVEKIIMPFSWNLEVHYNQIELKELYVAKGAKKVYVENSDCTKIVIPEGVKWVKIWNCENLRELEVPEGTDKSGWDIPASLKGNS